uniref:ERAP1-like C-terminal domain-containing protein n=1 Tax=Daphnia galeata TaxID=27404 RepID=A0A8J2RW30_9CRUS|nr:unnamed protein product [Daphnia galeata]
MISWACRLGVTECVNNATFLYKMWTAQPDNNNWVKSNYKRVVICAAIANTGDEEWNFALDRYLSTNLSSEKEMLLYALSCLNSPKALNTLLEWALDANSNIRRQDSPTVFRSVSANPIESLMVFEFVLQHWDKMLVTLSEGGKGDLGTATRSVQQALERTRINLEWRKRRFPIVMKLLDSWSQVRTFG